MNEGSKVPGIAEEHTWAGRFSANARTRLAGLVPVATVLLSLCACSRASPPGGSEVIVAPEPTSPSTTTQNILFLIADDLGVREVRKYAEGLEPPSTPVIDSLADSGVYFRNVWSNPVCSPTRAGVFTGLNASDSAIGITDVLVAGDYGLDCATQTLPEVIAGAGYVSGLFGKWHLGLSPAATGCTTGTVPLGHGFDRYEGGFEGSLEDYYLWDKEVQPWRVPLPWPLDGEIELPFGSSVESRTYATAEQVNNALSWILDQEEAGVPWMATVAFHAPHDVLTGTADATYQLPPAYRTIGIDTDDETAKYTASIEYMDMAIGRLLDELRPTILARTIVIFIGDNGTPRGVADASGSPGCERTLYEGGINVPFIVADGFHLAGGEEVLGGIFVRSVAIEPRDEALDMDSEGSAILVHTLDIFNTVVEIAGLGALAVDSESVLPYLLDESQTAIRSSVYTEMNSSREVRGSTHKLIDQGGT